MSFDRTKLTIKSIKQRAHDLDLGTIKPLDRVVSFHKSITDVVRLIIEAKKRGGEIILMMGAHVIRAGVQRYIIDLMEKGYITSIAMNGAGIIHDFEFALIGATTENVSRYIGDGQFGMWKETGVLNDIINEAFGKDNTIGMGKAVGREIYQGDFPHKNISLLASGYRLNIPILPLRLIPMKITSTICLTGVMMSFLDGRVHILQGTRQMQVMYGWRKVTMKFESKQRMNMEY